MTDYAYGFYLGECQNQEHIMEAIEKYIVEDIIENITTDITIWTDNVKFKFGRVIVTNAKTQKEYVIDPYMNLLNNKCLVIVFDTRGIADVINIDQLNILGYKNEEGKKYWWQLIKPMVGFDLYK